MKIFKRTFYFFDKFRDYDLFERPVFIISAPRSGSTLLYDLLLNNLHNIYGYSVEADPVWRTIFPRNRLPEPSDIVTNADCTPAKIRAFRRLLYRMVLWGREENNKNVKLKEKLGLKKIRYIEKTISNCFHLEAIEKIFPDASYIWLIRDPRAVYSSMLIGWRGSKRAEISERINPLEHKFTIELFPYPQPPKWQRNMINKKEAFSFLWALEQYILYPMHFFQYFTNEKFIKIRYEDLIANPGEVFNKIVTKFNFLAIDNKANYIKCSKLSRTTVLPPQKMKWKKIHGHIIEHPQVRPKIEHLMELLNY